MSELEYTKLRDQQGYQWAVRVCALRIARVTEASKPAFLWSLNREIAHHNNLGHWRTVAELETALEALNA